VTIPLNTDISTDFGPVRLVWARSASGPKVCRIVLPGDRRSDAVATCEQPSDRSDDTAIEALCTAIGSFLAGDDVRFDTGILDLDRCPPFQQSVLLAEYGIPRGYISTYGRIARYLERPNGARAVGNALARNPFPVVIPCHRAVRTDGRLGGFQGGVSMKRRLLEMEGVRFLADGRVVMDRVWY